MSASDTQPECDRQKPAHEDTVATLANLLGVALGMLTVGGCLKATSWRRSSAWQMPMRPRAIPP